MIRVTKSGKDDVLMTGRCTNCDCEVECMKHDATPCKRLVGPIAQRTLTKEIVEAQSEDAFFVCCPSCRNQHLYVKEKTAAQDFHD